MKTYLKHRMGGLLVYFMNECCQDVFLAEEALDDGKRHFDALSVFRFFILHLAVSLTILIIIVV